MIKGKFVPAKKVLQTVIKLGLFCFLSFHSSPSRSYRFNKSFERRQFVIFVNVYRAKCEKRAIFYASWKFFTFSKLFRPRAEIIHNFPSTKLVFHLSKIQLNHAWKKNNRKWTVYATTWNNVLKTMRCVFESRREYICENYTKSNDNST